MLYLSYILGLHAFPDVSEITEALNTRAFLNLYKEHWLGNMQNSKNQIFANLKSQAFSLHVSFKFYEPGHSGGHASLLKCSRASENFLEVTVLNYFLL